jgi:uncharacterized protein YegJ (DUF2314 family)
MSLAPFSTPVRAKIRVLFAATTLCAQGALASCDAAAPGPSAAPATTSAEVAPVAASGRDDVLMVPTDSPGMAMAMQLGAESWDEALDLYNAVPDDVPKSLIIKMAFPANDGNREFIWLDVTSGTEDGYMGEVLSKPMALPGWAKGDRIQFMGDDVVDWVVNVEGQPARGGFTTCFIAQAERKHGTPSFTQKPHACDWVQAYKARKG